MAGEVVTAVSSGTEQIRPGRRSRVQWADARSWAWQARDELDDFLAHAVIIDSDDGVSREWGRSAAARRRSRPRPTNDSWIAACCVSRGLPLAAYNVRDFEYHADHDGLVLITD